MEPIHQLWKKICSIIYYIMCYLIASLVVVFIFAFAYYCAGYSYPIETSIESFWGISNDNAYLLSFWIIAEVIVSNLFNLIIVSSVLIKFLKPLNPIIVSNFVTYNAHTNKFKFCYWIMLPENKFLFDVNIRIFLTTRAAYQDGVNALPVQWQSEDQDVTMLKQVRGIRYAQLGVDESDQLYKLINDENAQSHKYELGFVISGNDATGNRYYTWKRYKLTDIYYGFQFVPIQKHEYTSKEFFDGNEDAINIQTSDSHFPRELFRYQHFGKLFKLKESAKEAKGLDRKYILSEDEIIHGSKKRLKQKLMDFCSWIIMAFLDRSHWKSWWKKHSE